MIKIIIVIFILLLFKISNIEYFKNKYCWDHLKYQVEEYNRIIAPSNDYYLVIINLDLLKHHPLWDWNLRKLYYNNSYKNCIRILSYSDISINDLKYNRSTMYSKSKFNFKTKLGVSPNWFIIGDNPKYKKKKFNNKYTTISRNQKTKPTCIPFVISELYQNVVNSKYDYSPEYLYYWIKVYEKKYSKLNTKRWILSKRGYNKPTLLWRGLEIMNKVGMKYEHEIPYHNKNIHYPININYNNKFLKKDRILSGKFIYLYRNELFNNQKCCDILIHLLKNGPIGIVIGMKKKSFLHNNFDWEITKNNNINIYSVIADSDSKDLSIAHAILLYGYHNNILFKNDITYKGGFIFKNSWSSDWGTDGYSWITFDYVNKYFYESFQYINNIVI